MTKKIIEIMEGMPDYRKGNAIRHKLCDILMIGLMTFICNGNDFAAMRLFGTMHEEFLMEFLELPHGIPSQDTFERVFAKLNPKALSLQFGEWMGDLREAIGDNATVAIDGKTIRRSKGAEKKATHVVTAFASDLQLVLGQLATDEKSNEITAIPKLLDMFCGKGMVITIDAMGTQTEIAEKIIEKGGDYVLALKANQETLHEDASLYLDSDVVTRDPEKLKALEEIVIVNKKVPKMSEKIPHLKSDKQQYQPYPFPTFLLAWGMPEIQHSPSSPYSYCQAGS